MKKPELKWIALTSLKIISEYQRPTDKSSSQKNIEYIKDNFNWASCGALIVCEHEKKYAIIDGQHRFLAATLKKIPELPCVVVAAEEVKQQAANFVEINSKRIKLARIDEYKAAVIAGDATACMVADILKKAKITLPSSPTATKQLKPRQTMAIGTLVNMINIYSEKQILWALNTICDAYEDMPGMLRASLIKSMAQWIKTRPDTDYETMKRTLQDIDLDDLEKDARSYRAIEGKKSVPEAFMLVIEKKYNSVKRELK